MKTLLTTLLILSSLVTFGQRSYYNSMQSKVEVTFEDQPIGVHPYRQIKIVNLIPIAVDLGDTTLYFKRGTNYVDSIEPADTVYIYPHNDYFIPYTDQYKIIIR